MRLVSVVLPCLNEEANLCILLPQIQSVCPNAEIIVVNDGSTDQSKSICKQYSVRVVSHPYPMGNGAAIKTGVRHASGDIIVFMDADGQHDPNDIPRLLKEMDKGFEMVVGARTFNSHASVMRGLANRTYNAFASYMIGRRILDLTSGFRVVRTRHFKKFFTCYPMDFPIPLPLPWLFFGRDFLFLIFLSVPENGKEKVK